MPTAFDCKEDVVPFYTISKKPWKTISEVNFHWKVYAHLCSSTLWDSVHRNRHTWNLFHLPSKYFPLTARHFSHLSKSCTKQ